MKDITVFPIGISESCRYASRFLEQSGIRLTDHISPDITHLLLDIPSFNEHNMLKDGSSLKTILTMLPETTTVIGGNLKHNDLQHHQVIDLLANPLFQARNASITAECALRVAAGYLNTTFSETPTLILGWGRIGKCLAGLFKKLGTTPTVAARKESDRAILSALGYQSLTFHEIPDHIHRYKLLFNTVPEQTVDEAVLNRCNTTIKIDLASSPGLSCQDIVIARGLPGKYMPQSTGKLIAESILTVFQEANL